MLIARRITTVQSITRLPTSPRSIHTAMIRRKVSTGLLRASKSNSSLRSVAQVHAGSPSTQNAGFATSTLLSSQKNWTRETVVTLKSELKRRGLSQSGNKSDLVDRLKSFETSASLPPVPTLTNSHRVQAPSSSHVRNLSTSSVRQRSTKVSGEKSDQEPVAPTSAPVTSTGPDVVSQKTEAPKKEELKPEELSVAPGLPETKSKGPAVKDSLDVRLPEPKAKQVPEQTIPVTPDNFREPKSEPEPEASSSAPKVSTASSPSTLPGGGPVHAVHDAIDPEAIDAAAKKAAQEFPSFVASVGSVLQAPGKALKSSGLSTSLLPEIGPAKGFASGGKEYKASDKPLNAEEKRGAWVLGGIVALGLFLGGGKKDKKDSKSNHGSHASGSARGSSKPKGDATWEKASGAGIVGHGARKD